MLSTCSGAVVRTKPLWIAYMAASVREAAPILAKMFRKCTFTVLELMYKRFAISLLLVPVASNFRISCSRSVSSAVTSVGSSFCILNAQSV